jgi:hypothetical protein
MKPNLILRLLIFCLVAVSCTPDLFLSDQNLEFSYSEKIVYSFHDTISYKNQDNFLDDTYRVSRFYYGNIGHTLTGTAHKGAQAYCDYELLTFCKIAEPISCESFFDNESYRNVDYYDEAKGGNLGELLDRVYQCDKCFSLVKFMEGDYEKNKKLKVFLVWRDNNLYELSTKSEISSIVFNGTAFNNVYKTEFTNGNIKYVYYTHAQGIIRIDFFDNNTMTIQ